MTENSKKNIFAHGVVHGRFQPPHNGHIRYILAALERCEHLIVGICTPKICTEEEAAASGYPCTEALNPFTFEERATMVRLALDEAGIERERYTSMPFPSDYAYVGARLPEGTVFFMSITGRGDEKKIEYIKTLGFTVETVLSVPEGNDRERSGTVRESAKEGKTDWETIMPKSIVRYIKENHMLERLAKPVTVLK